MCLAGYPAGVSDHGFWAVQSLVTEPGPAAAAIDRLPSGLGALRAVSQQLVFHCWADGDWAENGIALERISEIETRYAAAMFARLGELADLPLSAARQPRQRLVGCCRDFTVLFVTMARHKGIPSRARVGFAGYLIDGRLIDHEPVPTHRHLVRLPGHEPDIHSLDIPSTGRRSC